MAARCQMAAACMSMPIRAPARLAAARASFRPLPRVLVAATRASAAPNLSSSPGRRSRPQGQLLPIPDSCMYDLSGGQVPWSQQQAWQDGAGAKPLLREVLDAANQQRRSQSLPSLVEMEIQAGIDMLDMAIGYADEQGPDRRILPLVLKHVVVSLMLAPDGRANARYWRIRAELPLAHNGARFGDSSFVRKYNERPHAGYLLAFVHGPDSPAVAEGRIQQMSERHSGHEDPAADNKLGVYRQLASKGLILMIPFDRLFRQDKGGEWVPCIQGRSLSVEFHGYKGRLAISIPSPTQLETGRRVDLTGCLLRLEDVAERLAMEAGSLPTMDWFLGGSPAQVHMYWETSKVIKDLVEQYGGSDGLAFIKHDKSEDVSGWLLLSPELLRTRWPRDLLQAAQREGRITEIPKHLVGGVQGQLGVPCKLSGATADTGYKRGKVTLSTTGGRRPYSRGPPPERALPFGLVLADLRRLGPVFVSPQERKPNHPPFTEDHLQHVWLALPAEVAELEGYIASEPGGTAFTSMSIYPVRPTRGSRKDSKVLNYLLDLRQPGALLQLADRAILPSGAAAVGECRHLLNYVDATIQPSLPALPKGAVAFDPSACSDPPSGTT